MPKKEITDYVIYKIICNDENIKDCYIGSTSNFKVRKWNHKTICNSDTNKMSKFKIYETIRNNGGWNNWSMLPIAEYKEISVIQARIKEEEQRVLLNASMNSRAAFRTEEELRQIENERKKINRQKEEVKIKEQKYSELYRESNKDIINERQKERYKLNDDEWKQNRNETVKKRRQLNKEVYNAYQREYYKKRQEKLKQNNNNI
jgi:hypothetical protein